MKYNTIKSYYAESAITGKKVETECRLQDTRLQ